MGAKSGVARSRMREGDEAAYEGLGGSVDCGSKSRSPGRSWSGSSDRSMLEKVRIEKVIHRWSCTETEEDTSCLEIGDASIETVSVVGEIGGGGGEEGSGKVVISEGTAEKASTSRDLGIGVAMGGEKVEGGLKS